MRAQEWTVAGADGASPPMSSASDHPVLPSSDAWMIRIAAMGVLGSIVEVADALRELNAKCATDDQFAFQMETTIMCQIDVCNLAIQVHVEGDSLVITTTRGRRSASPSPLADARATKITSGLSASAKQIAKETQGFTKTQVKLPCVVQCLVSAERLVV